MTMTSERKRDAAFKMLASFGFQWDGKAWVSALENTSGWVSPEEHQSILVVGDAMYGYVTNRIFELSQSTDSSSSETMPEEVLANELWMAEAWEIQTDCFARHRDRKVSQDLTSLEQRANPES